MNQLFTAPALPRAASLVLLLGGLLTVYFTTVQSLLNRWNQSGSEYGHGTLLVGVIIWLIFREQQRLHSAHIRPCYRALLPAALFSTLWSAGYIMQVNVVQQVALPCVVFFSIVALTGIQVGRIIWFPLSLIVFALPVWNVLQPSLQQLAVAACAQIFSIINIPVHIDRNFITVTSGTFQVATGCSGLNLFLAATVLGILFAHVNFAARRDQVVAVLLAVLLGVICNWVRITTIILIAQSSDNIQHPVVQNHGWLGWTWFALLFAGYLFFINRLPFAVKSDHCDSSAAHQCVQPTPTQRVSISALIVCMLGVYSAPLLSLYLLNKHHTDTQTIVALATMLGYPTQIVDDDNAWHPNFHGATSELHVRFAVNNEPVDFHLYFYASQSQGNEMIHFENTMADGRLWHIAPSLRELSNSANDDWKDVIIDSRNTSSRQPVLARYWYAIAGSNTTSSTTAKLLQLKGFLLNRSDAALVAISIPCSNETCEDAYTTLDKLTQPIAAEADTLIDNAFVGSSNARLK